ncbi:universal stress protein [Paenibacillus thalictri]|uniref:Universal stress protein n=1 Tax=Paenibacillus thalictri TaxID=2527873 RepID=A0A4Q9DEE8_9BACL|nr:universal stress protein [Paenibacillus thalictri]TBL69946.1 universal stress protein [Paenibacillus thalictri]
MLYSKIVVAYDGSEISDKALDSAIKMAKLNHFAKLEIIHVINIPAFVMGEMVITPPVKDEIELFDYSEQVVGKIKTQIQDLSNTNIEIRQGSPAKTILSFAEEKAADLIIIGSRGLNSFGEFVLGSVSHNVVQHAKIPVLVIK